MKAGPKSLLRPFLHRALQLYKINKLLIYLFIKNALIRNPFRVLHNINLIKTLKKLQIFAVNYSTTQVDQATV